MNKKELVAGFTKRLHKVKFKANKYAPEILVISGVVGVVVSGVLACTATTKLNDILVESKTNLDNINMALENPEMVTEPYSEEDAKKDRVIVYSQTCWNLVKLYAPSVILGTLSIGAILESNNISRKRNVALAAAYATIDKSFKEYRGRVVERFGNEVDKELKYNTRKELVKEQIVDENGKKKTVKNEIDVIDSSLEVSEYAKFYDDGCRGWEKDPEQNLLFLRRQQDHANELLQAKGYLFLNEVYDLLGIPRTKAGQIVGWIYDEKNPVGSNYVDFGIYDTNKPVNRDFVNGYERTILLDFNVDGNILANF